jgi:hypothetical protein
MTEDCILEASALIVTVQQTLRAGQTLDGEGKIGIFNLEATAFVAAHLE